MIGSARVRKAKLLLLGSKPTQNSLRLLDRF